MICRAIRATKGGGHTPPIELPRKTLVLGFLEVEESSRDMAGGILAKKKKEPVT